MKKLVWFLKYLWNDITGKDSEGRTAEEKKAYNLDMLYVSGVLALLGGLLTTGFYGVGAIPGALLFARKLTLRFTNTF